jgi:O-antigen/teichoic acid export membrane protein
MMALTLWIIFAVLQTIDAASTYYVIEQGIGHEANPVMRWLMDRFGMMLTLMVVKGGLICIAWYWLLPYVWVLAAMCVVYLIAAANNLRVILRN